MKRRHFLQFTGGITLTTLAAKGISAQTSPIEIRAWTPEGNPLPKTTLNRLYFLDLEDNPLPREAGAVEDGKIFLQPPPFPFSIALRTPVPGFGEVTLYSDNQGKGYTPADFPLNFPLEWAKSRLYRVRTWVEQSQKTGFQPPVAVQNRLHQALVYLHNAQRANTLTEQVNWSYRSLNASLWGGEAAVFAQAQQAIEKRGSRPNFLFGCNFFGFERSGEVYRERFADLFNFATLPLYWQPLEPIQGKKQFAPLDKTINWLQNHQITPKGHPLVWFRDIGIPTWIKDTSFDTMQQAVFDHVVTVTRHFGNNMRYYDVINEAHGVAMANVPAYSLDQLTEFTRIASEASHIGNPNIIRIVNSCCLYARYLLVEQPTTYSPYQYIKAVLADDIPFEAIGLQIYYPNEDMFEINRLIERFGALGKTIHITELGTPSASRRDSNSQMEQEIARDKGLWHNPWTEAGQADWIEQFYTICYSKPYIEAITWWDFADVGHFWAHGGLLRPDLTPKASFYRLKALINHWQQL